MGRNGTHVPRRLTKHRYARSTFMLAYREPCDPIRRFRACPYEFSVPAKISAACRDPLFFPEFSCQPGGSRNLGVRGYKGIKPTAHIAAALLCAGLRLFSRLPDSLSCWRYQPPPTERAAETSLCCFPCFKPWSTAVSPVLWRVQWESPSRWRGFRAMPLWVLVFLHAVGLAGLPVASSAARHGRTRNPATPFI